MPTTSRCWIVLLQSFRTATINARDFVYPALCVVCGESCSKDDPWLCSSCLGKLARNHEARHSVCPRCAQNGEKRECACDLTWDYLFERVFSFFDFDETIKAIAHHVKYKGKSKLAFHVGKTFAHTIPQEFLHGADGMLAVPLHFRRWMKRGYNQAEQFARGIIAGMDRPLPYMHNVLQRTRNTKTQTKLNREERRHNLERAFRTNPKRTLAARGKLLILVDDVLTTGATTDACAEVLLEAGAREVRVLSLGRD